MPSNLPSFFLGGMCYAEVGEGWEKLLTRRVATSSSISTASRAAWCFPTVRSDITGEWREDTRLAVYIYIYRGTESLIP